MNKFKMVVLSSIMFLGFSVAVDAVLVGTVNLQKTLAKVTKGQRIQAQLKAASKKKETEFNKKRSKLQKMAESLQKRAKVLAASVLAKEELALQKESAKLQEFYVNSNKDLQKKRLELTKPLFQEMEKLIPEISKKNKVDLTLEEAAGGLYYAANKVDLTEQLIKAYNKKHK